MMTGNDSKLGATEAAQTAGIPDSGRRVHYREYLIHGEIPGLCYVIYGRNRLGQLAELGVARDLRAAMAWVDRHREEMRRLTPVAGAGADCPDTAELPAAA